jgi:hypothetical protein
MDRQMLEAYIKRQVKKAKKPADDADSEGGAGGAPVDKRAEFLALPDHEKRQFVRAEEQGPTMKVAVRFYQLRKPVTLQHSFIVGVELGGLTEDISTIVEIARSASFHQLRLLLEEQKDRGMVRRTITFQALRHFMETCSNPHGYNDKRRCRTASYQAAVGLLAWWLICSVPRGVVSVICLCCDIALHCV